MTHLARIFRELLSRDHEDGCATWQPSRGPRDWFRGVPEWYVAETNTRGRQEGRPYPWSQQVIHEISGLKPYYTLISNWRYFMATINLRNVPDDLHRKAKARAAMEGVTLKQLIMRLLEEYLEGVC